MAASTSSTVALLVLATSALSNFNQAPVRIKGGLVLATRDEIFINTPGSPQNLCGESNFQVIGGKNGPQRDDCALLHATVEKNLHGFWMASKMGSDGEVWVEFTRLRSCGLKIRRTDGHNGDTPIGDVDVADLVNSVLNGFTDRDKLPTTQGKMTCSKDGSSAAVEWMMGAV